MTSAYVDESMRQGPAGLYVVATVVIAEDPDRARQAARSVLLGRQARYHWHGENEPQRRRMLDVIAELEVTVIAYTCRPVAATKSERARALCLDRLLWDLTTDPRLAEVTALVLESRQEHNDRKDRRIIAAAQRSRRAPRELRYRHERPDVEPLLWFPDAVAGAVSAHLAGDTNRYLDRLADTVRVVDVDR